MSDTDLQLLDRYTRDHAEDAFAEIVRRHVDLVHSAALRQVRSPQLAEEVAQSAFTDLARNAARLAPDTILTAWLYQVTRRTAIDVVRREARRQLREQIAIEMNTMNATASDWTHIEPLLDDAMSALDETDRAAVLLRYFENKSLREVGATLGTSDDAAQKRVSRAVERLREFFAKRGVTVGASRLVVVITANAVQAAPAGLAVTISTAAALAGTTIAATTIATATKTIAMTTLQKTIIGATLAAAVGTGIYEARQASTSRTQVRSLQQQQAANADQIERLTRERDDATARQATLQEANERLRQTAADIPKLRGELARLSGIEHQLTQSKTASQNLNDPFTQNVLALTERAVELNQHLEQMPHRKIPELQLLTESDWLLAAKEAKFDTDADVRKALSTLRSQAKMRLPMGGALSAFTRANDGQLPTDLSQLKPYFKSDPGNTAALDDATIDAIFARYTLLHTGNLSDLPADAWIIAEKAPVDKDYDSRAKFGSGRSTVIATGIGESGDPDDKSY
ncbi:MAG: sigma-70 family RNA polymerase sigma factor [Verrucomicrobiota bacterium]